jgi:quinol-cytochrome oxidoreductase complex cytochrome b subunit
MSESQLDHKDSIPFYPDHVSTEFKVVLGVLGVVIIFGILGLVAPLGLGEPADPLNTPLHVKPEWYFLALYQLLKYITKTAGAVAPVILVLVVAIWPFLDRKVETTTRNQRIRFIVVAVGMIALIAITIWGEVS